MSIFSRRKKVRTIAPVAVRYGALMNNLKRQTPNLHRVLMKNPPRLNGLGDVGDLWSDMRDKVVGETKNKINAEVKAKTGETVEQLKAKGAQGVLDKILANSPQITKALTEYKLAKTNIDRVEAGQSPLSTTDVLGFGKDRNLILMTVLGVVGLIAWNRKRKGA